MKELILYIIIAIIGMLLMGHLLERYGLIIIAGLVLGVLFFLYFPPVTFHQIFGSSTDTSAPASVPSPEPETMPPKDSLINVSPTQQSKVVSVDRPEKPKTDTIYISSESKTNTGPLPLQDWFDPNETTIGYIPEGCKIRSDILNCYVLMENVVQVESNAAARVEALKKHGFANAFYIYLPCYQTRIADDRQLFAVIMERPCRSLASIHQLKSACIARADQHRFKLKFKDKTLKIEPKEPPEWVGF